MGDLWQCGATVAQTLIDAALGIIDLGNYITRKHAAVQKVLNAVGAVELGDCPFCDPGC